LPRPAPRRTAGATSIVSGSTDGRSKGHLSTETTRRLPKLSQPRSLPAACRPQSWLRSRFAFHSHPNPEALIRNLYGVEHVAQPSLAASPVVVTHVWRWGDAVRGGGTQPGTILLVNV